MTAELRAALRQLGITQAQLAAMSQQAWPAGVPRNPADWMASDKRSLPIYAANCLEPDWQGYYEDEYMDFIEWQRGEK
jgi:hypothetical protein